MGLTKTEIFTEKQNKLATMLKGPGSSGQDRHHSAYY